MKQVLQERSGSTVVREVPQPNCPPGGVLVRNAFSAISAGTESTIVAQAQKSLFARAREQPDLVKQVVARVRQDGIRKTREAVQRKMQEATPVGYSSSGVVIEVGEAVRGLVPGDRVACAGVGIANHAEIVAVPRNLCAKVPDGVPLQTAALTTIAAIALHGIRLGDVRVGDRVAVVGCGLVGRVTLALLQATGAETFALDLDPARVELASSDGADHGFVVGDEAEAAVVAATGGPGVDAALITAASASNAPLLLGAALCRDRGSVVVVGDVPVDVPRASLFAKELSLRVSRSYGPGRYDGTYEQHGIDYPIGYVRWTQQRNMEAILALQALGKVDFGPLVEDVIPVEDAGRAYARLVDPPDQRPRGALVLEYPNGAAPAVAAPSPALVRDAEPRGSEPVRVGLIGPGDFAKAVIVPAFVAAGVRLEAVGGGSGPGAADAVRSLGFARAESETDLLADPEVDAVAVCTRHAAHADTCARALRAGKHVFCEKPLALSLGELDPVVEAARASGAVLSVGFNRRFAPLMAELRDFLKGGDALTAIYRVSAGALPSGHWVHDLLQGGGRALGEACHFVDTLVYLAGSPAVEVHAAGHASPDLPVQAYDNLMITLRFADGSVGSIAYVADGSPRVPKERVEAFCGNRTAILDNFETAQFFGPHGVTDKRDTGKDKGHGIEVRRFVEGVRTGIPPVPLDEVRNVSAASLAIVESVRSARPVRVDSLVPYEPDPPAANA